MFKIVTSNNLFFKLFQIVVILELFQTITKKYLSVPKGRVIYEAIRAASSKSQEVVRGWPAHEVQLTYDDTRLEAEYSKGNAWRGMNNYNS